MEGWAEARRVRRGGKVGYCGNVGSSCRFGSVACGMAGRGLLIRLWADAELAPRGNGRRESGRVVGLFAGARGEERETNWLSSREYHNASSSSSAAASPSSS